MEKRRLSVGKDMGCINGTPEGIVNIEFGSLGAFILSTGDCTLEERIFLL